MEENDAVSTSVVHTDEVTNPLFDMTSMADWSLSECQERLTAISRQWFMVQKQNETRDSRISKLEKTLLEKQKHITVIEKDRESLRNTVKRASENWFQRKAKISEGDEDSEKEASSSSSTVHNGKVEDTKTSSSKDDELFRVMFDLQFKTEQLELSERQCDELKNRVHDYESLLNDQESIVHGLKEQLDTYFNDNKKMSKQLAQLVHLFQELEAANTQEVTPVKDVDVPCETPDTLPTTEDFNEMSKSVSKTYMKLKELIYEKKSLVIEIERLNTLNVELQTRVSQQESRLLNVSDALQATWLVVSNLKEDHARLHTNETIIRYELKEKREILTKLREELEWAREQWHTIRQISSKSEEEWKTLRSELDERKERNRTQSDCSDLADASEMGACAPIRREISFEPPVDLLLDMGIEHGVIDADAEEPATGVALMGGASVNEDRLLNLETECSHLYHKLMSSTSRALALASRLTTLHQHYSASDDDDEEDEGEDDEEYEYVDMEDNIFETDIASPDPAGYDTAYVSETDGTDSAADGPAVVEGNRSTLEGALGEALEDEASFLNSEGSVEDGCDALSRRLITFLPKKIEILKIENKKLEEKIRTLQDEKLKSEAALSCSIEFEIRQKKKLEEQLTHLGKCVDELKLERNGKIAEHEEELHKKLQEVKITEEKQQQVEEELEDLREKLQEKERLFHAAVQQSENAEKRAITAETALSNFQTDLNVLKEELKELRNVNYKTRSRSNACSSAQNEKTTIQWKDLAVSSVAATDKNVKEEVVYIIKSDSSNIDRLSMIANRIGLLATNNAPLPTNGILYLQLTIQAEYVLQWSLRASAEEIKFIIMKLEEKDEDSGEILCIAPSSNLQKGIVYPRGNGKYALLVLNESDQCVHLGYEFLLIHQNMMHSSSS